MMDQTAASATSGAPNPASAWCPGRVRAWSGAPSTLEIRKPGPIPSKPSEVAAAVEHGAYW